MLRKFLPLLVVIPLLFTTLLTLQISAQDPQDHTVFLPLLGISSSPLPAPTTEINILRLIDYNGLKFFEWDNTDWEKYAIIGRVNGSSNWYRVLAWRKPNPETRSVGLSMRNLNLALGDIQLKVGDVIDYSLAPISSDVTNPMTRPSLSSNIVSQIIGEELTPIPYEDTLMRVTDANEAPGTIVLRWLKTGDPTGSKIYHSRTGNTSNLGDWSAIGNVQWNINSMLVTDLANGDHWFSHSHPTPNNDMIIKVTIEEGSLKLP